MAQTKVIILNGAGSAGKSSIARTIQKLSVIPIIHVQMDAFLEMLPERLWNHPDGITFRKFLDSDNPMVAVDVGAVVVALLAGMRAAIAAMAAQGNNLIVDDVILDRRVALDYRQRLDAFEVKFVGIVCPLQVLEQRERQRGDREIGLARWQHDRVHQDISYDLQVDTAEYSPEQAAKMIMEAFGLSYCG